MIASARRVVPVDAVAVGMAANIFAACNESEQALRAARSAIALADEQPTMSNRFYAHMGLAYALMNSDPEAALRAVDESLDAVVDSANFPPLVWTFIPRVVSHLRLGLVADACADLVTALPAAAHGGLRWGVFQLGSFLVPVLRHAGDERRAWAIYLAVREVVHPAATRDLVELPAEQRPPASGVPVLDDYDHLVQFVLEAVVVAADRLHVS